MEHPETVVSADELLLSLTADVVAAYVSNNSIRAGEVPALIADVHAAFARSGVREEVVAVVEKPKPAISPKNQFTTIILSAWKTVRNLNR